MKKVFIIMMALFLLISVGQRSNAGAPAGCYESCDSDYNNCVAPVINMPEPRTPEEQSVLDQCRQDHDTCQHECETYSPQQNQPNQDDQPKQEDNK